MAKTAYNIQLKGNVGGADNHSKILLVKSEAGDTISVITSQNLTRGNCHESAFISTSPDILRKSLRPSQRFNHQSFSATS